MTTAVDRDDLPVSLVRSVLDLTDLPPTSRDYRPAACDNCFRRMRGVRLITSPNVYCSYACGAMAQPEHTITMRSRAP